METYFAYRLPNESAVHFLKGTARLVDSIDDLSGNGFVFHSFLGDQILFIQNGQPILETDFITFQLNELERTSQNKEEYFEAFEKVKRELESGVIQKMILSRIKENQTQKKALAIFADLNRNYSGTFNYVLSNQQIGTWVGATPEVLLSSNGNHLTTVSLAGTKPADGFSEWTEKEKREQKYVTDFILEIFQNNDCDDIIKSKSYTFNAGPIDHIKSDISAQCKNENVILKILKELHPTPATCGIPKLIAQQKIQEIEEHSRKFYTGFIGILDGEQKRFFVNLRCMELQKDRALLYVGGGITSQSIGESEWNETERKAETLLNILQ